MVGNDTLREINAEEQELFRRTVSDRLPELTEEHIGTPFDALVGVISREDNLDYIDQLVPILLSAEVSHKIGKKVVTLSRTVSGTEAYTSVDTLETVPGQQPNIEKFEVFDEAAPRHVIFGRIAHPNVAITTEALTERSQTLAGRARDELALGLNIFTTADLENVMQIISQCDDSNRLPD